MDVKDKSRYIYMTLGHGFSCAYQYKNLELAGTVLNWSQQLSQCDSNQNKKFNVNLQITKREQTCSCVLVQVWKFLAGITPVQNNGLLILYPYNLLTIDCNKMSL